MAGCRRDRRTLAVLCLAGAAWAFNCGLGATLAPLWMRDAGRGAVAIGLNTSTYYLGVAAAALFAPWLMKKVGRSCVVVGVLLDALATALFPWAPGPVVWFGLRLLSGAATAACLIPMETLINHNAPPERRARDFGRYAFAVALGLGLGTLAGLPLYPFTPRLAFALGGLTALPAAFLVSRGLPPAIAPEDDAPGAARPGVWGNRLSLVAAWAQGFLEGGMVTFLSLHLLALGYGEAQAAGLMGALFLGVVLFQAPSAWLADRCGRRTVLLAFHAVLLVGLGCLPFCTGPLALGSTLFVVGGCCAALYPLGLALLGERTPPGGLARANAWYLASNCAGSLSGPVLMGAAIELFHTDMAMFGVGMVAAALAPAVWLIGPAGRARPADGRSEVAAAPRRMAG